MVDDPDLPPDIDLALNEATWFGVQLDPERRSVALDFEAMTLPEAPGGEGHAAVTLVFREVARIVVSFRRANWDDDGAAAVPVSVEDLSEVVESFGGVPIYGWEFFDLPEDSWARWSNRLSLDLRWRRERPRHSITVFKEGQEVGQRRHLDCRLWFDALSVRDVEQRPIPLEEFAAGGRRWWDGMYAGDERTRSFGIVPLKRDEGGS